MRAGRGSCTLLKSLRNGIIAIAVTAVVAVLVIQLAAPPAGAQTVGVNNLPGTMALGHSYSFYVTINMEGITTVKSTSTITLSVAKSSGAAVTTASFNGTGVLLSTGGFLQTVSRHNGSASGIYGYGGTTGYVSYVVSVDFPKGGVMTTGQYSLSATLAINSSSATITSPPVVFSLVNQVSSLPYLAIFVVGDIVVIGVVVYVVTMIRKGKH